jgi:hypothetical protein
MADPAGSDQRITAAERRARVVALRRQRLTFDRIGQTLGVTKERAWKIYQEALASIPAADVEEHRAEELTLIDDAISALMRIARTTESARTAVEAWNSIRGWAERKASLLGLDAPTRHEFLTIDQIDREIAKLKVQLAEAPAAP